MTVGLDKLKHIVVLMIINRIDKASSNSSRLLYLSVRFTLCY
jgi:hypothetical protein